MIDLVLFVIVVMYCMICVLDCVMKHRRMEVLNKNTEMVEVSAMPMSPTTARQCTNKIIIKQEDEII
jgi:hypothetical protein